MLPTFFNSGTLPVLRRSPPPLVEALSEFPSACWELTHDMFYLQRRRHSGKRMTNISRYLVEVSLSSILPTELSDSGSVLTLPFPVCLPLFFCAKHLLTFSLQDGDVQGVEEAQARLSFLAQNKKLWSQQMFLDVGAEAIYLRDIQSQVRTRTPFTLDPHIYTQ